MSNTTEKPSWGAEECPLDLAANTLLVETGDMREAGLSWAEGRRGEAEGSAASH